MSDGCMVLYFRTCRSGIVMSVTTHMGVPVPELKMESAFVTNALMDHKFEIQRSRLWLKTKIIFN